MERVKIVCGPIWPTSQKRASHVSSTTTANILQRPPLCAKHLRIRWPEREREICVLYTCSHAVNRSPLDSRRPQNCATAEADTKNTYFVWCFFLSCVCVRFCVHFPYTQTHRRRSRAQELRNKIYTSCVWQNLVRASAVVGKEGAEGGVGRAVGRSRKEGWLIWVGTECRMMVMVVCCVRISSVFCFIWVCVLYVCAFELYIYVYAHMRSICAWVHTGLVSLRSRPTELLWNYSHTKPTLNTAEKRYIYIRLLYYIHTREWKTFIRCVYNMR